MVPAVVDCLHLPGKNVSFVSGDIYLNRDATCMLINFF